MFEDQVLLFTGVGAFAVGLTAATLIVWRDLGPAARLTPLQRVALIVALGGGVLAFGLKLTVIETLSLAGRDRLAPTLAVPEPTGEETVEVGRPIWEALPTVAPSPADDPPAIAKIALGRRLFHEPRLSRDGSLSCASCHDLDRAAGADARPTALGIDGQIGGRNTPSVWDVAFQSRFFWDGRARSLEEQALGPIANPIEMGADPAEVAARLAAEPEWRAAFAAAFGPEAPIDPEHLARALAAFERTLVTGDAPFDRFVRGDTAALTPQQIRGMALFESVGCVVCHAGPGFSRASLLAPEKGAAGFRRFPTLASPYAERYRLTEDRGLATSGPSGVWRIPSLRNVALTGPYFHNGSVADLTEAVRVMATVQAGRVVGDGRVETRIEWSPETRRLTRRTPAPLSEAEVADIVAFLHALTGEALAARTKAATGVPRVALGTDEARPSAAVEPEPPRP